jgi:glycosyltransferase involved in cell wall biosynthesis
MRIALFSTEGGGGGAARAMRRLALGLTQRGHEVDILQRADARPAPNAIRIEAAPATAPEEALADFVEDHYIARRRSVLSDTLFTAQSRGYDLGGLAWLKSYDVLNLHWVQSFLNPETIDGLIALGRPVVFTLHDMAGFTGGCHYAAGCGEFERHCNPCPQLNEDVCELPRILLAEKRRIFPRPHVAAVAPSRWLADAAARAGVFPPGSVHHIGNSVETDLFRPSDRTAARQRFGVGPDERTILFGANHNGERRKGFRHLMAAIRRLWLSPDFAGLVQEGKLRILVFGQATPEIDEQRLPVTDLGYVDDDRILADAYSAADLVVLPSLDDNQPNILLEAMACGTPVVGFAVGGLIDVIRDGQNGRLVPPFDVAGLAEAILDLLLDPEETLRLGARAQRDMLWEATLDVQARRYEALFAAMLQASGAAPAGPPAWAEQRAAAREHPISVPVRLSPRLQRPEVVAAQKRFITGEDRYITPELADAAELRALRLERAETLRRIAHHAQLVLGSRSWRLGRRLGLGKGLSAEQIAAMPGVPEKLEAIWALLLSRRWEVTSPLRLLSRLRRRGR